MNFCRCPKGGNVTFAKQEPKKNPLEIKRNMLTIESNSVGFNKEGDDGTKAIADKQKNICASL